jgi:hypothetical protein
MTMAKVYKIHPAIGIARVGNHTSSFFVGPEAPGKPAIEFDSGGNEIPLTSYKQNGLIKRQAARFRVLRVRAANRRQLATHSGSND